MSHNWYKVSLFQTPFGRAAGSSLSRAAAPSSRIHLERLWNLLKISLKCLYLRVGQSFSLAFHSPGAFLGLSLMHHLKQYYFDVFIS